MDFAAIDVETANADMASICQVGVATFRDGALCEEWVSYVDPDDYFDGINVSIHGIDESMVEGAPRFGSILEVLNPMLDGRIVVCHTHFDRVAIQQSAERYGSTLPICRWLDSARVARRAWSQFAQSGYGLASVCAELGIRFKHHDALEDAKAAGQIVLAACEQTGLETEAWLKRVRQPIDPNACSSVKREGNPDGPLYGEVVVFTGSLSMPRREAADQAAIRGCTVKTSVSKKTTLLVVGDQDIRKLAGHEISNKHRKAEELITSNTPIRIMTESDFSSLIAVADAESGDAE